MFAALASVESEQPSGWAARVSRTARLRSSKLDMESPPAGQLSCPERLFNVEINSTCEIISKMLQRPVYGEVFHASDIGRRARADGDTRGHGGDDRHGAGMVRFHPLRRGVRDRPAKTVFSDDGRHPGAARIFGDIRRWARRAAARRDHLRPAR